MSWDRTDPYLDFRYVVELVKPDGTTEDVGGFSEVGELTVELETEEYEEGGVNDHPQVLPTRASTGEVSPKRGLTDEKKLWGWLMDATRGRAKRKELRVVVQDRSGGEAVRWGFSRALPVRWSGPDLAAENGQVAVEELALACERVTRLGGNG